MRTVNTAARVTPNWSNKYTTNVLSIIIAHFSYGIKSIFDICWGQIYQMGVNPG